MDISEKMIKNSLVYRGDVSRIETALKKAQEGQDITVAFLGGSITQGCNATSHDNCYAYKTYLWFKETFSNSNIKYINAGVGATGSVLGVHRLYKQVISQNPDIVFIDFAVNDSDDMYDRIAYESIIRKLLSLEKVPGIVEVFMSNFNGLNVQDQQILIGKKYNIPMISYRDAIFSEIFAGNLTWNEVGTDEVHPNNYGHHIISSLLINFISNIYNNLGKDASKPINLGKPLFGDKFINGTILNNKNIKVNYIEGFKADEEGFQVFHDGWTFTSKNGGSAKLSLEVEGKNIFLVYKMRVEENAAILKVTVDGKNTKTLNTFFKNGWGNYSNTELLVEQDKNEKHKIEIVIEDTGKDTEATIMGILVS